MNLIVFSVKKYAAKAKTTYKMQPQKSLAIFLCVSGICFFFILAGILAICLSTNIYEAILSNQMVLKPNSNAYNMWVKNPVPISLTLYMFNWTNPEEVYNKTSKPRFEQLGPYVYRETKEKTDVVWNNDNDTVTFKNIKTWWFDPESSKGNLYDPVTSINPVALSAAHAVRNWHMIIKRGFSVSLRAIADTIYSTHSVGELLFDGYEDPLLTMAAKMSFLPKGAAMDKFGWFYGRNGSSEFDGIFNIDTGARGNLGVLERWKFSEHTGFYPDKCGNVQNASAGDFFPRKLTHDSVIKMFTSDLCRYMELEFEEEVLVNNIVGYKYVAGQKFLDNGTKIPENKCFCDGDCMPSGALNVSNCRHGSPAFVSLPHFYKADPYYLDGVDGLSPEENMHSFYMIFEPNTGIPLSVAARLQLNLRLAPVQGISIFEDVPTVFMPVLYFEQKVDIPEHMTFMIKLLINFNVICLSVGIICITLSSIVFLIVFYKMWSKKIFRKQRHVQIPRHPNREEVPLNH
ncbi:unnamed protein product [Psylliodes chrysocephalus]|uniref:Uncharacterized protein n=1 Tax=Psylliodes chrysocephalus TaxID=3402493 RepID=A0A9P0D9Q1_9CUCU|nr:unnamed protein product [Psylliodes chrysocephala]